MVGRALMAERDTKTKEGLRGQTLGRPPVPNETPRRNNDWCAVMNASAKARESIEEKRRACEVKSTLQEEDVDRR